MVSESSRPPAGRLTAGIEGKPMTAPIASAPVVPDVAWYALDPLEAAGRLEVDPVVGLTAAEAAARLKQHGPNALDEAAPEPTWKKFAKQYREYMQIVLVGAAAGEPADRRVRHVRRPAAADPFQRLAGLQPGGKAEAAAAALGKMMKAVAKVRRDGDVVEVAADQLVPGDIVLVDAGDRVPADGRVIVAATLAGRGRRPDR